MIFIALPIKRPQHLTFLRINDIITKHRVAIFYGKHGKKCNVYTAGGSLLYLCAETGIKKGGTQCRKICCPDIWGQKKHPTSGAIPRTPSAAGASRGRSLGPSRPRHAAPGSSQRMPSAQWSKRRSTAGWSKLPQGCAFLWLIPQNPSDKRLRSGSSLWKNRSYTSGHRKPSYSLHRSVPVPGGTWLPGPLAYGRDNGQRRRSAP